MRRGLTAAAVSIGVLASLLVGTPAHADVVPHAQVQGRLAAALPSSAVGDPGVTFPMRPETRARLAAVDAAGSHWRGTVRLEFGNSGVHPLRWVWVRLWANGPRGCDGGSPAMRVTVGAGAAASALTVGCTALRLRLDTALRPGRRTSVVLNVDVQAPRRNDRFGRIGDFSYFGNVLPVPAVRDALGWHLDRYIGYGESFYSVIGDFAVSLRHPVAVRTPASGRATTRHTASGEVVTTSRIQRARDFAWAAGPFVRTTARDRDGNRHNVWRNPRAVSSGEARRMMKLALRTLPRLSTWLGRYPYGESDVVLDDFTAFGGMEYPGFVLSWPYAEAVAHELAHNWMYGIVGDDEYATPWLDEGFTEYLTDRLLDRGDPGCSLVGEPPGQRLTRSMGFWAGKPFAYGYVVYECGASALYDLQRRLGTPAFDRLLGDYARANRFGFSTVAAWKAAAEDAAARRPTPLSLATYWERWRIDG